MRDNLDTYETYFSFSYRFIARKLRDGPAKLADIECVI